MKKGEVIISTDEYLELINVKEDSERKVQDIQDLLDKYKDENTVFERKLIPFSDCAIEITDERLKATVENLAKKIAEVEIEHNRSFFKAEKEFLESQLKTCEKERQKDKRRYIIATVIYALIMTLYLSFVN